MNHFLKTLFFLFLLAISACGEVSVTDKTVRNDGEALADGEIVSQDLEMVDQNSPAGDPKYIEGEFTLEKAMEVVYGYYDKGMECSKWVCEVSEAEDFADKMDEEGNLYTKAAAQFTFETTEGKKAYLVTATAGRMGDGWETCHACAPVLGLAQFGEIDGNWYVEALRKNLGVVGAWGEIPENQLVQIGPNKYGIMFTYGYTSQGFHEGGIRLIGLANDKFEVLMDRQTTYSNEGYYYEDHQPELAYGYDTEFSFVKDENPDYYDLRLIAKGKKNLEGKDDGSDIALFEEEIIMIFENGKYLVADSSLKVN